MHILVTGASGFAGRHIIHWLLKDGFRVTGVCNKNLFVGPYADELTIIQADLLNDINRLPDRVDAVVHAAACLNGKNVTVEQLTLGNVNVTRNIINYAKLAGSKAFIYLSSTSVFGNVFTDILDKSTPINSPDVYGITKLLGEKLVEEASCQLPSMSIRLPGVIGDGAHGNFVATMMELINEGQTVKIFNPTTRFNNVVDVSNLSHFISTLLSQGWIGSDVITIGAGTELQIIEIPKVLMKYAKKKVFVETVVDKNKPAYIIDNEYAKENYGYNPEALQVMLKNFARIIDR